MAQMRLFPDLKKTSHKQLKSKKSSYKNFTSSIWSFTGSDSESIYRWYGTLPRPLIQKILDLYCTNKNTRILEPFSGLGTALNIASEMKLKAIGFDNNPLACLIAETKLHGLPSKEEVSVFLNEIEHQLGNNRPSILKKNQNDWKKYLSDSKFDYTKKWFRKDTLNAVLALLFQIADVKDVNIQRLFFVIASNVIRDTASVDPRCTHHLVTKKKPFIDPVSIFKQKVLNSLPEQKQKTKSKRVQIKQKSIFNTNFHQKSFDFALIHPPYLGMIHYHLIHRLATDLLDIVKYSMSPKSLEKYDFDYNKIKQDDVSTDSSKKYSKFVEKFANLMSKIISDDGRCCVIIGDQRHKQHLRHPFTEFVKYFEKNGFVLEENFIWILQNNGGMHILRRGHFIDHNYILVFHKVSI